MRPKFTMLTCRRCGLSLPRDLYDTYTDTHGRERTHHFCRACPQTVQARREVPPPRHCVVCKRAMPATAFRRRQKAYNTRCRECEAANRKSPKGGLVGQRFWGFVNKTEGCWLWVGANNERYGLFSCFGRVMKAHRASWHLFVGPIPPGLHVLHKCDNPLCVRPDHLFLGTHVDNMADMARKGRARPQGHPSKRAQPAA